MSGDQIDGWQGLAGALLLALPEGAVLVDARSEVVVANPAAVQLGLAVGTMLVDRHDELAALIRLAHSGVADEVETTLPPRVEFPLVRAHRDQERTPVRVRVLPVDPGRHVALLLEDLTDAKRVEAVRRDFVANVSHELKTPVGALHLLAEAIQDASDEPAVVRRFALRMQAESERLTRTVQELIDLSRLQGAEAMPTKVPVRVGTVVGEAVDRVRLAAQNKDIVLRTVGDTDLVVAGDERQLATAVANLLANAVAYSPDGTSVVVGLVERVGSVEISVRDEGIGIAPSDAERIFERFYRVDPARSRATGGTGLGLAIVKHIMTNHNGSVQVWSSEGSGSTFTLYLPSATTS